MNRLVLSKLFSPSRFLLTSSTKRSATSTNKKNDFEDEEGGGSNEDEANLASIVPDVENSIIKDLQTREEIERMRNVSRFPKHNPEWKHRNTLPDLTQLRNGLDRLNNKRHYCQMYARLGRASGIDPSLAWPTKTELDEIIGFEKEYDMTLEKKIQILIERKSAEFEKNQKL